MKSFGIKPLVSGIVAAAIFSCQFGFAQAGYAQELPPQLRSSASTSTAAEELTPGAIEVAKLLNILPKVERLRQLETSHTAADPISDEELGLKVDILDRVMKGSLEVRMLSARIDRELAWAFSNQGMLNAKKQKYLNYLFAANFLQGGILGTLSGPAFLHGQPKIGTQLLLLASSIGLGLSIVSFAVANSGSKKMDTEPTVLSYMFDLNPPEPAHRPEVVLKFLQSPPPAGKDQRTRKQILVESWQAGHFIKNTDEETLRKLAGFEPPNEEYKDTVKLIGSRIRMLFDTQYTIEQLDGDLLDLLRATDIN